MARMTVEQRREALVAAAYRVIAAHGVEGATTRRVCAEAEMPLASFHYAFESRMAMLATVIDQAVPRDLVSLAAEIREEAPMAGLPGVEQEVTESMRNLYTLMVADPGRMHAIIALALFARNHEDLRAHGRRMWERLYAVAAGTLRSIAEANGTGWLMSPEALGPILIAATNAVTMAYLTTADEEVTQHIMAGTVRWMMSYAVPEPATG